MTTAMASDDKLIYMANQIAAFFAAQGEERAAAGIADHIEKFWTPVMRQRFLKAVATDDARLSPAARLGLARLREAEAGAP